MDDPGAGVTLQGMLNSIISESTWGSLNEASIEGSESSKTLPLESWTIVSEVPSRNPPADNLLSYGEFLETRTTLSRPERKALKTTFTEPGRVGDRFRSYFEKLIGHMSFSDQEDNNSSSKPHFILPSFYHFLIYLNERDIDYRIIFRTFGTDAIKVAEEYNSFCLGEHKYSPSSRIDMSHRTLLPNSFGKLRRSQNEVTLEASPSPLKSFPQYESSTPFPTITGIKDIYLFLRNRLQSEPHAFSIQDDFLYWNSCGESDGSGKLLIVDSRQEDHDIVQIFFDDNIERDRAHIVDVRDVANKEEGSPIPFLASNGRYLCRVSPLEIISDDSYFIKEFENILRLRS